MRDKASIDAARVIHSPVQLREVIVWVNPPHLLSNTTLDSLMQFWPWGSEVRHHTVRQTVDVLLHLSICLLLTSRGARGAIDTCFGPPSFNLRLFSQMITMFGRPPLSDDSNIGMLSSKGGAGKICANLVDQMSCQGAEMNTMGRMSEFN